MNKDYVWLYLFIKRFSESYNYIFNNIDGAIKKLLNLKMFNK